MKTKKTPRKLMPEIILSQKALDEHTKAMAAHSLYKKTSDLMERIDIALGRKSKFTVSTASTLNLKINHYEICTTTAHKI